MARCIIRNATVVMADPATGVVSGCDILIDGDTLAGIRSASTPVKPM